MTLVTMIQILWIAIITAGKPFGGFKIKFYFVADNQNKLFIICSDSKNQFQIIIRKKLKNDSHSNAVLDFLLGFENLSHLHVNELFGDLKICYPDQSI